MNMQEYSEKLSRQFSGRFTSSRVDGSGIVALPIGPVSSGIAPHNTLVSSYLKHSTEDTTWITNRVWRRTRECRSSADWQCLIGHEIHLIVFDRSTLVKTKAGVVASVIPCATDSKNITIHFQEGSPFSIYSHQSFVFQAAMPSEEATIATAPAAYEETIQERLKGSFSEYNAILNQRLRLGPYWTGSSTHVFRPSDLYSSASASWETHRVWGRKTNVTCIEDWQPLVGLNISVLIVDSNGDIQVRKWGVVTSIDEPHSHAIRITFAGGAQAVCERWQALMFRLALPEHQPSAVSTEGDIVPDAESERDRISLHLEKASWIPHNARGENPYVASGIGGPQSSLHTVPWEKIREAVEKEGYDTSLFYNFSRLSDTGLEAIKALIGLDVCIVEAGRAQFHTLVNDVATEAGAPAYKNDSHWIKFAGGRRWVFPENSELFYLVFPHKKTEVSAEAPSPTQSPFPLHTHPTKEDTMTIRIPDDRNPLVVQKPFTLMSCRVFDAKTGAVYLEDTLSTQIAANETTRLRDVMIAHVLSGGVSNKKSKKVIKALRRGDLEITIRAL